MKSKLASVMDDKGITVEELSRRSGISISTIHRMKHPEIAGELYSWVAVASALNVTVSDLIGEIDGNQ